MHPGSHVQGTLGSLVLLALGACSEPGPEFPTSLADGMISGMVTDTRGEPVFDVHMAVHPPTADSGKYEIGHSSSITNTAGAFEVGVAVLQGEFHGGIPPILQLYLLGRTSEDPAVIDSVLVPVALAEAGEHFVQTRANLRLPLPQAERF
jgi:hypothetical protein